MLSFDPDRFAVVGEAPMTRMELPGKQLAPYGLVRDVWLTENDLPYRMVSFSCRDLSPFLEIEPKRLSSTLVRWGWEQPKYRARQAWMRTASKGLSWEEVRVYTYPEAEALLTIYAEAKREYPQGFGRQKTPELAQRVNRALGAIRDEMEVTYD